MLMAKRENFYTVYVFKILNTNKFITVSKPPNWNTDNISVGQEGFLTYKFVQAGKDTWWSKEEGLFKAYQYSANYFLDFIPTSHVIANNIVTEKKLVIG